MPRALDRDLNFDWTPDENQLKEMAYAVPEAVFKMINEAEILSPPGKPQEYFKRTAQGIWRESPAPRLWKALKALEFAASEIEQGRQVPLNQVLEDARRVLGDVERGRMFE